VSARPIIIVTLALFGCEVSMQTGPERTGRDADAFADAGVAGFEDAVAERENAPGESDTGSGVAYLDTGLLDTGDLDTEAPHRDAPDALDPDVVPPPAPLDRCDDGHRFPSPTWDLEPPESHGLDSRSLEIAARYAGQNDTYCMAVVRHGALVGEWYFGDTDERTPMRSWSVAKSYAATVAGIALDQGLISALRDPVADYVPEWAGTEKEAVTLHNVLSMTSGMHFDLVMDNVGITMARDMTQRALDTALDRRPGYAWEYNNHTVQVIERVLRNATGVAPDEFARTHLFEPIGMDATWERDRTGNPAMYMNVEASCRDHARFGYLYLRRGCWDGAEVLSDEFVEAATTPSSPYNQGYGYWWWLNGHQPLLDSVTFEPKGHIMHTFAPDDAFCAVGLGNQMIEVIPSLDMVVVRMGPAPHENLGFWLFDRPRIMQELQTDGEQRVHNGVLERVLDAIVD
jgi:CubicO group peptidase (beta-lactamase class C family)